MREYKIYREKEKIRDEYNRLVKDYNALADKYNQTAQEEKAAPMESNGWISSLIIARVTFDKTST